MTSLKYNERDLIETILTNFFIVDYGVISKVNGDKTVNVVHAIKHALRSGEKLPQTETKNVELLFLSGKGFSIAWDIKGGDKVLLLGLKDYVEKVKEVTQAKEDKAFSHYDRATLKAIPLCLFDDSAEVTFETKDGTLKIKTQKNLEIATEGKLELNGKDKQFVTWQELNTALTNFTTLLNSHVHTATSIGAPTSPPVAPMSIDISQAKTTTVVTGG